MRMLTLQKLPQKFGHERSLPKMAVKRVLFPVHMIDIVIRKNSLETNNRPLFYVFVSITNLGPSFQSEKNFKYGS